jgi:hypothetical protein
MLPYIPFSLLINAFVIRGLVPCGETGSDAHPWKTTRRNNPKIQDDFLISPHLLLPYCTMTRKVTVLYLPRAIRLFATLTAVLLGIVKPIPSNPPDSVTMAALTPITSP